MILDVLRGIGGSGRTNATAVLRGISVPSRRFVRNSSTLGLLRPLFMTLIISSRSVEANQKWQAKMVKRSLQEQNHTVALLDV